jgi:hypothetical protein
VAEIRMYQATGKKTVPLFSESNSRRVKYQVFNDFLIAESRK